MRYLLFIIFTFIGQLQFINAQVLTQISAELGSSYDYEEIYIPLNGGCSLGCAIGWSLSASSTLKPQGENNYFPDNMNDGVKNTAWVEGKSDYGIGEKIIIQFFDHDKSIINVPLRSIGITNGYAKSVSIWDANSRVRTFRLYQNSTPLYDIELINSRFPQWIKFPQPLSISAGDKLQLEIIEVYPGSKWSDTAISDIAIFGAH